MSCMTLKTIIEPHRTRTHTHTHAQHCVATNLRCNKLDPELKWQRMYMEVRHTLFLLPACWAAFRLAWGPICCPPCVSVSASAETLPATAEPGAPPCMFCPWNCMPATPEPRPLPAPGPKPPFITCPGWACPPWARSPAWPWVLFIIAWVKPVVFRPIGAVLLPLFWPTTPVGVPAFWAWGDECVFGEHWPKGLFPSVVFRCTPSPPDWGPAEFSPVAVRLEELPARRSSDSCLCLAAASGTMVVEPPPPRPPGVPPVPGAQKGRPRSPPLGINSSGRSFSRSSQDREPKSTSKKE